MILLVTINDHPRLQYVLEFIRNALPDLKIEHQVLNAWIDAVPKDQWIVAYGNDVPHARFHQVIPSAGLLFEESLRDQFNTSWDEEIDCFAFCREKNSASFDWLSAIFFLISRYEEYWITPLDDYGRFPSSSSALVKANQQHLPWVNIWLQKWVQILNAELDINIKLKSHDPICTMDIDIAFEFLGRRGLRKWGAFLRDLTKPSRLMQRISVMLGWKKDPGFIFPKLRKHKILYFIQMSDNNTLDRSCGLDRPEMIEFLNAQTNAHLGVHPSTYSYLHFQRMMKEMEELEVISNKEINLSRFHFIKMKLPYSYHLLIELGIRSDYSMGWPDIPGYRAGTNFSFRFFDLLENESTPLMVYPFSWMDAHYCFGNSPMTDLQKDFKFYLLNSQKFGGQFIPIFHNNHFQNHPSLYALLDIICPSES